MTPEQLRILKTLPKVIEAVRAFQAEANELMGLLEPKRDPTTDVVDRAAALTYSQREQERLSGGVRPPAPPVLATLRAVPDAEAEQTRKAAEAELSRRQANRTPEQKAADEYLEAHAGERASMLAAILPGGKP